MLAPLEDFGGQLERGAKTNAKVVGVACLVAKNEVQVVLKVLTDTLQVMHHFDAMRGDILRPANARQLQKLR